MDVCVFMIIIFAYDINCLVSIIEKVRVYFALLNESINTVQVNLVPIRLRKLQRCNDIQCLLIRLYLGK